MIARWLGALSLVLVAAPAAAEIPALIEGDDPAVLTWVSLERAAPGGRIDWEYFSETTRQHLEWTIAAAHAAEAERSLTEEEESGECVVESWSPHSEFGEAHPPRSPQEYANGAYVLVDGVVLRATSGFYRGGLGTAYDIEILSLHKWETDREPARRLLVFWPSGLARLEDTVICSRGSRAGERPQLGSRVLVAIEDPATLSLPIFYLDDQELFFERSDGSTSAPLRYPSAVDLTAFVDRVRGALKRRELP